MSTVAIIHAAEDTLPARALAEKLRQGKLAVVLEKQPGEQLRSAVQGAKVTIALWSPRSVAQPELVEDATFARGKSKLVHAVMQNAAAPEPFRNEKIANLTGWRGEDAFPGWRELAKLVTDRAGVSPLPPPAPRPPSGFFQPGVVNPAAEAEAERRATTARKQQGRQPQRQSNAQPRSAAAPRTAPAGASAASSNGGGGRTMLIAVIAFVVVAAIGGGGYWFWSQSQGAQSTSAAWDAVDTSSAAALRSFISGDPGDYRDEAEAALASLEERSFEAASDADTIEALEAFLNDFPQSEHALVARGRIAELRTLQQEPAEEVVPTPQPIDPDLLPPTTTPEASSGGPTAITPPANEAPSEPEADPPTN